MTLTANAFKNTAEKEGNVFDFYPFQQCIYFCHIQSHRSSHI